MTHLLDALVRLALFAVTILTWVWCRNQPVSVAFDVSAVVGTVVLVHPVVWVARRLLDRQPTGRRAVWITRFTHFALMILFGAAIIRAVVTHEAWMGWRLPIPGGIGWFLVIVTGAATLLTVIELAWRGLGAPFAIALSGRLAANGLYAWTRNPMVLGTLSCLVAIGLWFQSVLFVLWVLVLVTPAWLVFVRVYEERELEIRFGAPYLEYKTKTPMLFPRRPRR